MNWDTSTFAGIFFVSAALTAVAAYLAWRRWDAPAAPSAVVLMLAATWWSTAFALELADAVSPAPLFWFKTMFLGVVVVPASFLVFVFRHTGRHRWVTPRTLVLLSIMPVATVALLATDSYHHLFLGGFRLDSGEPFVGGPGFWLHSLYSYTLSVWALALLFASALHAPRFHRKQTVLLLLGAIMPSVCNIISVFQLVPLPDIDLTPVGFVFAGAAMVYNLRGQGLLDLVPIARDAVVEGMDDGVLVLDFQNRVVDLNPAARGLLGMDPAFGEGQPVASAIPCWEELDSRYRIGYGDFQDEVRIAGNELRYIDLRITPLEDRHGRPIGRLVLLHDISHVKRIESELRDQLAQNEMLRERLQEQVIRDPLTGLYNRRFLEETLMRELAKHKRTGAALSVALIDLDRFKQVNDTFGHGAGDEVLQAVGGLLRSGSRGSDVACRFGGEEFVLVMPEAGLESAVQRIDELRRRMASMETVIEDQRIVVTFSAGVAEFPRHGADADSLLDAADQALYAAKRAGRDRVHSAADEADSVAR